MFVAVNKFDLIFTKSTCNTRCACVYMVLLVLLVWSFTILFTTKKFFCWAQSISQGRVRSITELFLLVESEDMVITFLCCWEGYLCQRHPITARDVMGCYIRRCYVFGDVDSSSDHTRVTVRGIN